MCNGNRNMTEMLSLHGMHIGRLRSRAIFTVRRSALHGLSHRNSVCPSVRLSVTGWTIFCPHKFLGAGTVKIVPTLSPLPRGTSTGKSPERILPLTRKLLRRIR